MKYLAISNNAWGKADSIGYAKTLCKANGGRVKGMTVYRVSDDYYIDEMGDAHGSKPAELISGKDQRSSRAFDDEPVTDDDRSNGPGKLGHNQRGESDIDLLLLGGCICALIFILGGLWMDGTLDFRPWEFIRYTIETAGRP